jgi:DNA-binding transcriptional ArsR family regulator
MTAKVWETAEEHRQALEVLQLGLRRRILKFIGQGAAGVEEVAVQFGLDRSQAAYHLSLLERSSLVEQADVGFCVTYVGSAYLAYMDKWENPSIL